MIRIGRIVVALLGVSLWHGTADACVSDSECKGDRICVNGACQEAKPSAAPPRAAAPREDRRAAVQFRAKNGREVYRVTVAGETCVTPCTLRLGPGANHVVVRGAGAFEADIDVPEAGTTIDLSSESRAVKVTGVMLGVTGTLAALSGMGWYIGASQSCKANYGSVSVCSYVGPIALLASGAVTGLTGYIMVLASGSSRADLVAPARTATGQAPVRFLGLGLDVGPSRMTAPTLVFSF